MLAILAVGVRARYYPDAIQPWHANNMMHERVMAYGDVIAETKAAIDPPTGIVPIEKVRQAAALWVDGAEKGKLHPLTPAFYVDTTMEGPKIEIERYVSRLSSSLMLQAEKELQKGNFDQATRDAIQAFKVSEIIRSNDLTTAATGASRERRAMLILAASLPKASAPVREETRMVVEAPREGLYSIIEVALNQRDDWTDRYHQPRTSEAVRTKLHAIASEKPKDYLVRAAELKGEMSKNDSNDGSELLFNAARAIANEWTFEDARQKAAAAL